MVGIDPIFFIEVPGVRSIVMKGIPFCHSVCPRFLWYFRAGYVLASPWRDSGDFLKSRLPLSRILRAVFGCQGFEDVGSFQYHTTARMLGYGFTEVAKKLTFLEDLSQRATVVDRFFGQLNDRAGFDVTTRTDVVREAGDGGAQGLALSVMIRIDHDDGFLDPRIHDKLPNAT